jgi:uncharacterized protein
MSPQLFEWDPGKAATNLRKHGVTFDEAQTAFADPLGLDFADDEHSSNESRWIRIGLSARGRLLVAVYTERRRDSNHFIRLISARAATGPESRAYLRKK